MKRKKLQKNGEGKTWKSFELSEVKETIDIFKGVFGSKVIDSSYEDLVFMKTNVGAYNGSACAILPWETNLEVALHGSMVQKLLNGLKDSKLKLRVKKEQFEVRSGKTEFGLICTKGGPARDMLLEIHKTLFKPKFRWHELPSYYVDAMSLTWSCASTLSNMPDYGGVYFHEGTIWSADGRGVARYCGKEPLKKTMYLPAYQIAHLCKIKPTHYGFVENWVYFKLENGGVYGMLQHGGLFKIKEATALFDDLKSIRKLKGFVLPSTLKESLRRGMPLLEDDELLDRHVRLSIWKDHIRASLEVKERGWFGEEIQVEYKGNPFEILVNPNILLRAMEHATNLIVVDEGKALLRSGDFEMLIPLPIG